MIASVHLSSYSDKKRRQHANFFFQKQFESPKSNADLREQAKRFNLIMEDFNERGYLMRSGTVSDRGYLTNFMNYGFDFSQRQLRPTFVNGTYGFTKIHDKASIIQPPESVKDPRGRPHNAKGGFLDRIVFSSGLLVDSAPGQYGALTDVKKFKKVKDSKINYSTSDHLPVIRFFTIKGTSDDQLINNYDLRLLPNFALDIQKLQNLKRSISDNFKFYDDTESFEKFKRRLTAVKENEINVKLIN